MSGDAGKGSRRRPMQISEQEFSRRWEMAFGKTKKVMSWDEFMRSGKIIISGKFTDLDRKSLIDNAAQA